MKQSEVKTIKVPESVQCSVEGTELKCIKNGKSLSRNLKLPGMTVSIEGNQIKFEMKKSNKKDNAKMSAIISHVKNMFTGVDKEYVYEMEICYVHFPMTVKVEGGLLVINNFLGEKQKRTAKILKGVDVKIDGQTIIVSSNDIELAGQTAANIEKATKVTKRDRRIFQDGIFIVKKGGFEE